MQKLTLLKMGDNDIAEILQYHVPHIHTRKLVPISGKKKTVYEAVLNQFKTVPAGYTALMLMCQILWLMCHNYEILLPKLHLLLIPTPKS